MISVEKEIIIFFYLNGTFRFFTNWNFYKVWLYKLSFIQDRFESYFVILSCFEFTFMDYYNIYRRAYNRPNRLFIKWLILGQKYRLCWIGRSDVFQLEPLFFKIDQFRRLILFTSIIYFVNFVLRSNRLRANYAQLMDVCLVNSNLNKSDYSKKGRKIWLKLILANSDRRNLSLNQGLSTGRATRPGNFRPGTWSATRKTLSFAEHLSELLENFQIELFKKTLKFSWSYLSFKL